MGKRPTDTEEWYETVPSSIRRSTLGGVVVIAVTFGGFGAWATTATLASAVVAQGTFVATGENKLIQHLEGGIIEQILVREGDKVERDAVLMVLDETASRANWRRLMLRVARYEAQEARLQATISGAGSVTFPATRIAPEDVVELERIKSSQVTVFEATRLQLEGKLQVLRRNAESLESRVAGAEAQKEAIKKQIALIDRELEAKRTLVDKGLFRRSELYVVERAAAEAAGALGKIVSDIADNGTQIERLREQQDQTRQEFRQGAMEQLQNVSAEIDDMREQMSTASGILGRTEIRAPVAGTLVKMNYHTPGGVIESGKLIAEILPDDEALVIETMVRPSDIDNVRIGHKASVRLTSFNQRTTPQLTGSVSYVSADAVPDPTGAPGSGPVYVVRLVIDEGEQKLVDHLTITPGMPAEVFLEASERTFVEYLVKPVTDSMQRAFRER